MLTALSIGILTWSAQAVTVQVDPRPYVFEIRRNLTALPPGTVVAFNANYFWQNTPIGVCSGWPSIVRYVQERPVLDFGTMSFHRGALSVQAGPTLVRDGRVLDLRTVQLAEHFQDDIYRTCEHVAVGITKSGKLVVAYAPAWSVGRLASHMHDLGLITAMNLDGGHSAMLYVNGRRFGNQGLVPVAVVIRRRQ